MDFSNLKKVELHLHLDGSIRPETLSELKNIPLDEAKEVLIAKDKCVDLNDYLKCFSLPVSIMQTKEELIRVAKELVEDLIKDNCIYAEVRFAPNKHTSILSLEEVVESVLSGLKSDKIKVNLLLCMMRGDSYIDNLKVIDLAYKYKDRGVCGIDLAGAEGLYKTGYYLDLFKRAKELGLNITIHAGEADGASSIKAAISAGALRIGHGVRALESEECLNKIREKEILLEVCPTSNVQTNVCESIEDHPIDKLLKEKILLSINTDNRTVSNTTLTKEYNKLNKSFGYNEEVFTMLNINAIKHAFISEEEKEELINKLKEEA